MENSIIAIPVTHSRRHWKKAYFTMRGWAFMFLITTILFAIGFGYAMFRTRTIQPDIAYEIISQK